MTIDEAIGFALKAINEHRYERASALAMCALAEVAAQTLALQKEVAVMQHADSERATQLMATIARNTGAINDEATPPAA